MRFWILNVFASEHGGGNQLAVVDSGQGLDTSSMQQIAADFNFSETTFLESPVPAEAPTAVRIFTPRSEIPFAGHPVLGTAETIRALLSEKGTPGVSRVELELGVGRVPVDFGDSSGNPFMTQQPPEFGRAFPVEQAARLLGLPVDGISHDIAPTFVSTGARFLVVPLASGDLVPRARVQTEEYEEFQRAWQTLGIGVFAPYQDSLEEVRCRVFAPGAGIPEDPATGSHAGCLAATVARAMAWQQEHRIVIHQGVEMGRPSLIYAAASANSAPRVGGRSVFWAGGRLD